MDILILETLGKSLSPFGKKTECIKNIKFPAKEFFKKARFYLPPGDHQNTMIIYPANFQKGSISYINDFPMIKYPIKIKYGGGRGEGVGSFPQY